MNGSELVIGVDGGGTKTVACLATRADPSTILGRGIAGPANIRAVGESVATSNLDQAIAAAFVEAGIDRERVSSACLGLAGADRDQERAVFHQWQERRRIAKSVQIVNDALPVLYAASADGVGIALIAGTGSFAFGRNAAGATVRCGGWGYLFGDEGSGYAIALAGLQAAARSADGRSPQTRLLDLFLNHFSLRNASELISTIYTDSVDRTTIAGLAGIVFDASDRGDKAATEIISRAAGELAELAAPVTRTLNLTGSIPLAITGGILLNQESLRASLLAELAGSDRHSYSVTLVAEPVAGAIRMARKECL